MRIVLIGNGWLPIPPPTWGAVEILIWNIYQKLVNLGHQVKIVNTHQMNELIEQTNSFNPDIVHLHSDEYYKTLDKIHAKGKFVTSHHGLLPRLHDKEFHNANFILCALTPEIKDKYISAGMDPTKIIVTPNGIDEKSFYFYQYCLFPNRSIYLATIDHNKRQEKYQVIDSLYFVGNIGQQTGFKITDRYLGEWRKPTVYSFLTTFANLVLLSNYEAHSLAVSEALICGLGVVVSEAASGNLDRSKPWITVIPNDKLDDINYIQEAIRENRKISITHRNDIRKHALETVTLSARMNSLLKTYKTSLDQYF
jgi:glycosyltransferase involved in cell wall biosynthesis